MCVNLHTSSNVFLNVFQRLPIKPPPAQLGGGAAGRSESMRRESVRREFARRASICEARLCEARVCGTRAHRARIHEAGVPEARAHEARVRESRVCAARLCEASVCGAKAFCARRNSNLRSDARCRSSEGRRPRGASSATGWGGVFRGCVIRGSSTRGRCCIQSRKKECEFQQPVPKLKCPPRTPQYNVEWG